MSEQKYRVMLAFSVPKSDPFAGRVGWLARKIAIQIAAFSGGVTVHEPDHCLWHEDGNNEPPYFEGPSEEVGRSITFTTEQPIEEVIEWLKRIVRTEVKDQRAPVEWVHVEHEPVHTHHFNAQK